MNALEQYKKPLSPEYRDEFPITLIHEKLTGRGIDSDDIYELMGAVENIAYATGADFLNLSMIILDSVSGENVMTVDSVVHQLKVALDNAGLASFF